MGDNAMERKRPYSCLKLGEISLFLLLLLKLFQNHPLKCLICANQTMLKDLLHFIFNPSLHWNFVVFLTGNCNCLLK